MSLDYRFDGIENWKEVEPHIREAFVWATMAVGIGQLTEELVPVFYGRMKLIEKINGPWWNQRTDKEGVFEGHSLTPKDVRRMVGLWTNATFKPEAEGPWLKRQLHAYKLGIPKAKGRVKA